MSYIGGINKIKYDKDLIDYIQSEARERSDQIQKEKNPSLELMNFINTKSITQFNGKQNTQTTTQDQEKLIRMMILQQCIVIGTIAIGFLLPFFVNRKVGQVTVQVIEKRKQNKKLFAFLEKEIKKVYEKHPDYKHCSLDQFYEEPFFDYLKAEWVDKTPKELSERVFYRLFDSALTVIVEESIPLPGSVALVVPIKLVLSLLGFNLGTALTNIISDINGHVLTIGVNLRPIGFALTNIMLYSYSKNNKLVATKLKDPPDELYKITKEDAKEILEKYKTLDILRKDVRKFYGRE